MNTNHVDTSITVSFEIRNLLSYYVVTKGKLFKVVSSFSESFENIENIIQNSKISIAIDGHHFRSTFDGIFSSLKINLKNTLNVYEKATNIVERL